MAGRALLAGYPQYHLEFLPILKHWMQIEYHVNFWQVLPQLSCGDTCQIWISSWNIIEAETQQPLGRFTPNQVHWTVLPCRCATLWSFTHRATWECVLAWYVPLEPCRWWNSIPQGQLTTSKLHWNCAAGLSMQCIRSSMLLHTIFNSQGRGPYSDPRVETLGPEQNGWHFAPGWHF